MGKLPTEARDRLKGTYFWHMATLNDDGSPQVSPVWVDVDDTDRVLVNTFVGRRKEKNLRRDGRVALSVTDHNNVYGNIQIQGTVVDIIEGRQAEEHIDRLSAKYTGTTPYAGRQPGERRVMFVIQPDRVAVNL